MSHELAAGGHIFSRTSFQNMCKAPKKKSHRNVYHDYAVIWIEGGGGLNWPPPPVNVGLDHGLNCTLTTCNALYDLLIAKYVSCDRLIRFYKGLAMCCKH